jgi:hypothetical protein
VAKKKVLLYGTVTAGERCSGPHEVSVLARTHGTQNFTEIARVLAEDGSWEHRLVAKRNTAYSARPLTSGDCEPLMATPIDVLVKVKLTAAIPKRCSQNKTVRGRVAPNLKGTRVVLQRKRPGGWKKIDRTRLNGRSRFKLKLNTCQGRYRIRWLGGDVRNERNSIRFRI